MIRRRINETDFTWSKAFHLFRIYFREIGNGDILEKYAGSEGCGEQRAGAGLHYEVL